MKLRTIFFTFIFIVLMATYLQAQSDYEQAYNPKTGNVESQYNPWNSDNVARNRMERNREMFELQQKNRDAENQRTREMYKGFIKEDDERAKQNAIRYRENVRLITERHFRGLARIKSGNASTTFTNSSSFSLKGYLSERISNTTDGKQIIEQYAAIASQQFHQEMNARGLIANDLADGFALEFVICYEIFSGQKTTDPHLQSQRKVIKPYLLSDSMFQGGDSLERQKDYEYFGVLAMYAKMLYEKKDPQSIQQAKAIAESILPTLWKKPAFTILMTPTGFIHKGKKIIDEGKATHLYSYNPNLRTAQKLAKDQKTDSDTAKYQNYLDVFYQEMTKRGGQKNDVASMLTFSLVADYVVLIGQEPNVSQVKSVYELVKNAVLKSPDAQAASDEIKQNACEIIAIRSIDAYQNRDNPNGKEFAKSIIGEVFQALGEDLNNYKLTENGIVKVK